MERNEISRHEIAFFHAAKSADGWRTAKELADTAGIAHRTGRAFALKFVRLGIADQAEVWPAHRYRWSKMADKRNRSYVQRLEQASEVFSDEH